MFSFTTCSMNMLVCFVILLSLPTVSGGEPYLTTNYDADEASAATEQPSRPPTTYPASSSSDYGSEYGGNNERMLEKLETLTDSVRRLSESSYERKRTLDSIESNVNRLNERDQNTENSNNNIMEKLGRLQDIVRSLSQNPDGSNWEEEEEKRRARDRASSTYYKVKDTQIQSIVTLAITGTTLLFIILFSLVKLVQCCCKCRRPSEPASNAPSAVCFTGPCPSCPSCALSINCGSRPADVEPRVERVASHKTDTKPLLAHEVCVDKIQHV